VLVLRDQAHLAGLLVAAERIDGGLAVRQLAAVAAGRPALVLARRFVAGKVRNQASLIKSLHKYRKHTDPAFAEAFVAYVAAVRALLRELRGLPLSGELATERGRLMSVEGRAAAGYWKMIARALPGHAGFAGRVHRGADDLVNALLNYAYAVLQARVPVAVCQAGLLPQGSVLHAYQPGKPTLVFDLMEEFRAPVADRAVVALLARGRPVAIRDGLLTSETRTLLVRALERRLATLVPYAGRRVALAEVVLGQARAVAKHLLGERPYRPFAARW